MPKLRVISGSDVVKILESFGFVIVRQRGSHIKLKRLSVSESKEILTVPNHKEIDRGTLNGLIKQCSKFVPETELRKHFYN